MPRIFPPRDVWLLTVVRTSPTLSLTLTASSSLPPSLLRRPNNIGLSVCEIVSVGPLSVDVKSIDLVDGACFLLLLCHFCCGFWSSSSSSTSPHCILCLLPVSSLTFTRHPSHHNDVYKTLSCRYTSARCQTLHTIRYRTRQPHNG